MDGSLFYHVILYILKLQLQLHQMILQHFLFQHNSSHTSKWFLFSIESKLLAKIQFLTFNIIDVPLILKWLQKKAKASAKFPSLTVTKPFVFCSWVKLIKELNAPLILNTLICYWSSLFKWILQWYFSDNLRDLCSFVLKFKVLSFWRRCAYVIIGIVIDDIYEILFNLFSIRYLRNIYFIYFSYFYTNISNY